MWRIKKIRKEKYFYPQLSETKDFKGTVFLDIGN